MRSAKSQTLSGCRSATCFPEGRAKSGLSQRERCHKVTERVETLPALITPTLHNGYFYFNLVVLFQSQILV